MAEPITQIRIVKRKKGHAGHHGGAWKVAFADFMTAMMAFFLVMWIVGLSPTIKEAIAAYFKDPVAFSKAVKAGNAPFGISQATVPGQISVGPGGNQETPTQSFSDDQKALSQAKEAVEKILENTPEFKDLKEYVEVKLSDEGLQIELLEAKESLFFDSGSAKVNAMTATLLEKIAAELGKLDNKIVVEGHTDSRPLATKDYTNWELSSDRANGARRVMEESGLHSHQIAQVRGYADTKPRDPAHPEHFSNRRVSIMVLAEKQESQAKAPEALKLPAEPTTATAATPIYPNGTREHSADSSATKKHTVPELAMPQSTTMPSIAPAITPIKQDELPGKSRKQRAKSDPAIVTVVSDETGQTFSVPANKIADGIIPSIVPELRSAKHK